METLATQFQGALARINLSEAKVKKAKAGHEEVRAVLEADPGLKEFGVDTILIGSYARNMAIQPGHDVDVFSKLPDFDADPETLYDSVRAPLKKEYGNRLDDSGGHALTVSFGEDFSVDVVGAAPSTSGHWQIPALDEDNERTKWDESDPERLNDLAEKRNRDPEVGGQGAYKPVVKMVRQIRRHHLKDARPGGLYFEMLTYWAFEAGVSGDSFAELLAHALDDIAGQLETGEVVHDPALDRAYEPPPAADQLARAARVMRDLATKALAALGMGRCPAAATWRAIFGQNDNGWVFPLPEDCDETGKTRKATALGAIGSNEGRGFARS
jgi:hypothetical protein